MAGKARFIPVFDGVWIDAAKHGRFVRRCSLHGRRSDCGLPYLSGIWTYGGDFHIANRIAAVGAAKSNAELDGLIKAMPDEYTHNYGAPYERYGQTAAWLTRTLGFTRGEILAALERIAGRRCPPPGYEFLACLGWPYSSRYAARVGVRAAARLAYPALVALTESCAEYSVLALAVEKSGERLARRLEPLCVMQGLSEWTVAILHIRRFLGILRERHRYVL